MSAAIEEGVERIEKYLIEKADLNDYEMITVYELAKAQAMNRIMEKELLDDQDEDFNDFDGEEDLYDPELESEGETEEDLELEEIDTSKQRPVKQAPLPQEPLEEEDIESQILKDLEPDKPLQEKKKLIVKKPMIRRRE